MTRRALFIWDQAGHWILQPVPSTGPAALSPGTGLRTVNMFVGIALRGMRFADKYGAHELVVAGAVFRLAGLQSDFRRQLEPGERTRQRHRIEGLLLVGDRRQRLYRRVAEPVAGRRRSAGDLLH